VRALLRIVFLTKVGLIQLGCPKNQVDGEEMLGAIMESAGDDCSFVGRQEDADVLVVNTCAFIESAKQESIDAILRAVRLKEQGKVKRVIVTGCLSQRYGAELSKDIPEVDAFLGIESASSIGNVVFGELPAERSRTTSLEGKYPLVPRSRLRSGARWTAYLKISEGCDHACTFCSIPSFRGRHRSKPIERLVTEAQQLADSGAIEICLIAQDTTAYGMDLYNRLALPELLRSLSEIDGIRWLRLLYCYPTMVRDDLIETIAANPKVLPYIDMPLQHGDDGMLKLMKRGGSVDQYRRLFEKMRSRIENLTLRTTFIVGFPGETDVHFDNLLRFVADVRFDRLGVFTYSQEEGTPAAEMSNVVGKKTASTRRDQLMRLQQTISGERNREWIGRSVDFLAEMQRGTDTIGRTVRDAPEIDGSVVLKDRLLPLGEIIFVHVTGASAYDLTAEVDSLVPA